jgi:GAF domain-containing protein
VPDWSRSWLLPILALLFTAGAAVSGAFIQDPDGGLRTWPMLGAIGCILAAGVLALVEKRAATRLADEAISEQADVRVAMNDILEPLVTEFGRALAAQGMERVRLLDQLVPVCLNAAASLLGGQRTRASFFRLEVEGRGDQQKVFFRPEQSQGRAGRPRTVFTLEDDQGFHLANQLSDNGYDFCEDVERDPPPGFTGAGHGYRTYLSVFARHGAQISGVVTVDSPQPGDLSPDDRHFLNVVATLISIAHSEAAAARRV